MAIGWVALVMLAVEPPVRAQEAKEPPPATQAPPATPTPPASQAPAAAPAPPPQPPPTSQIPAPTQAPPQPQTPSTAPTQTAAQTPPAAPAGPAPESRAGRASFGFGLGPMMGTESSSIFGMDFTWDYYLTNAWSVGPLLQVGLAGNFSQVGLSGQVKYWFDLPDYPKVRPHLEGGVGFIHLSESNRDETKFLMPLGSGIDVQVVKHLFLNSTVLLNISNLNNNLFVSWMFGFRVEI